MSPSLYEFVKNIPKGPYASSALHTLEYKRVFKNLIGCYSYYLGTLILYIYEDSSIMWTHKLELGMFEFDYHRMTLGKSVSRITREMILKQTAHFKMLTKEKTNDC